MHFFTITKHLLLLTGMFFSSNLWAQSELGLRNKTPYYFVYTGSSASDGICKQQCYKTLTKGNEQWVQLATKNAWLDIQYNVCEKINYANTDPCEGYLGHFSLSFSPSSTKISSGSGGTTTIGPYTNGIFEVTFSPENKEPIVFPTPATYDDVLYRGVNLTGGEYDYAFQLPDAESAVFFVEKGMNSIRLPFKWEYLQPAAQLGQPVDFNQGNAKKYADLVKKLTDAKLFVIIDMHNYMRYESKIIGVEGLATRDRYAAFWGDFAHQFKDNQYVIFDLMNEPHDMQTADIIKNYNSAMSTIRANGFNNLILLEGNKWSGLENWTLGDSEANTIAFARKGSIIDPLNNYAVNVHQYFDRWGGSTGVCYSSDSILQIFQFEKFVNWLHENNLHAFLTETGGAANVTCAQAIDALLKAVEANPSIGNAGGFLGWNAWDGGRNKENAPYRKDDLFYLGDVDAPHKIQMEKGFQPHLKHTQ